ncbi:MAG: bacillithiol biosynthesis cysteine-adding enzyme BshC [Acidobacteria bacterium]|nr:MAG: bacillithiol biosynthesis cysteine-adding enzyme BshC [Acidobacteriota bacterium]
MTTVPYARVPRSSALFLDFLNNFERVNSFYDRRPFEPSAYMAAATELRGKFGDRRALVDILEAQNRTFRCSEKTLENIRRLISPDTFAVVTGQQVGLVSGPAFTLYKALTAVRLAEHLTEKGLACVPVFWLATEDHDLEEVAAAKTLDDEYNLVQLKDPGQAPAPRAPVGRIRLTATITEILKRLEDLTPPGEPRDRLMADLGASYQPGETWGNAFARLMAQLFAPWGVVLLDPLDEAVHRLARPVYERALREAEPVRRRLLARSEALVRAGYHAQVHIADDSTTLFLFCDGSRQPVTFRDGTFFVDDAKPISASLLQEQVQSNPFNFTPNALLRPVVQDTLLPTVAYVAGAAELAYFGQALALYEPLGNRPQPVVFPRAGFTLVDRRIERLMEKYGATVEDAWKGEEQLSNKVASNGFSAGWAERLERSEKELGEMLEGLQKEVAAIDPTLVDSVGHARDKMLYQVGRLKGKIARATLERSELLARHEQSLARFLAPAKSLQEREVSGIYFLGRAGYGLLERLLEAIRTDSCEHHVMVY